MAKLEIPLNMNPSLTAALEKVSDYAGRLETERKALVDKLNHAESVIHDLTGDKELLKSELERSRDMANYSHGQLYLMNEYCLKNGFEFVQNNPALTMIHEIEKLRSERDALAAQVETIRAEIEFSAVKIIEMMPTVEIYALACSIIGAAKSTPQQCLAEIKAEAGRDGFVAGYMSTVHFDDDSELLWANNEANQYADKIRNTGTWLKDSNVNGGKRQGGE